MVRDVLHSIYRPGGAPRAEAKRVTMSLDLLLFHPAFARLDRERMQS